MIVSPRPLRTLLAVIALCVSVEAQGKKSKFDPTQDLEGYELARISRYAELFPLDKYVKFLGTEVDEATLASLRASWKAESEIAFAEVRRLDADPKAAQRWRLERDLEKHPYFSKIAYTLDASLDPWLFVIQNPAKADPEYNGKIVQQFGPWLKALDESFQKRYVAPLALARRADQPWNPIVILASDGDLGNFAQNRGLADWWYGGVYFDPGLRFALANVDPFSKPQAPSKQVEPLLHEAARLLMQAHYSGPGKSSRSFLLVLGLAAYSGTVSGLVPASLATPAQDAAVYRSLVRYCQNKKQRNALLFPLQDLAGFTGWEDLLRLSTERANAAKFAAPKVNDVYWAIATQASAWASFLQHGNDGARAAGFAKLVTLGLQGLVGPDAYRVALAEADLSVLDREFWAWVLDQDAKLSPKEKVDRTVIDGLFTDIAGDAQADASAAAGGDPANGAGAGGVAAPAPFDPKVLHLAPNEWEARVAAGLARARGGDLAGAKTDLEAIATGKPPAPWDVRVAREVARLGQACALRDAYFESLRKRAARFAFEKEGKKYNLVIASIEGGDLVFGESKQGLARLPMNAIELQEIARQAAKKEDQGGAAPWTRAYLQLLCGEAKWDKLLGKDESQEVRDLREDAQAWHPACAQLGALVGRIEELASAGLPASRAQAERTLTVLRELAGEWKDHALVKSRRRQLEKLGRAAYDGLANELGMTDFVHGELVEHADGTATLAYDFKRPEAALDLARVKTGVGNRFAGLAQPKVSESDSTCTPSVNGLEFEGRSVWRLGLEFEAPMRVHLECHYYDRKDGGAVLPSINLLICADAKDSYILVGTRGGIVVRDLEGAGERMDYKPSTVYMDTPYALDLEHDGKRVWTTVDGEVVAKLDAGKLTKGRILLIVNSDTVFVLQKLEIEGKLVPGALPRLRKEWAEAQSKALGF